MTTQTSPLIQFKQVNFNYSPSQPILTNFNFSIYPQQKIIIFGKSGLGKSTLFQLILGFQQPQTGQILFKNQPITSTNIWKIRQQIAYVSQDTILDNHLVIQTIREYFNFQANQSHQPTLSQIKHIFTSLSLPHSLLQHQVAELSGGERQRLAIAIATLLHRPIFLLDEITSALDSHTKKIILNYLLSLSNITLIAISHDSIWRKQKNFKLYDFGAQKWTL